jgi:hypothetical protein
MNPLGPSIKRRFAVRAVVKLVLPMQTDIREISADFFYTRVTPGCVSGD